MNRPLLLDLYCGAGGAAKGYHDAGFDIIGVDSKPQPRYPYKFLQVDVMELMEVLISGLWVYTRDSDPFSVCLDDFSAIHASPPCQSYTKMRFSNPHLIGTYPDLVEETRELLVKSGLPYVIENVMGAPLIEPVKLCGSQFNLTTVWEPHGKVGLRRHRLFETNFPLPDAGSHDHSYRAVPVYGHGSGNSKSRLAGRGCARAQREVMGIDWMKRDELDQAIPPAMTRYVGEHLMRHLNDNLLPR